MKSYSRSFKYVRFPPVLLKIKRPASHIASYQEKSINFLLRVTLHYSYPFCIFLKGAEFYMRYKRERHGFTVKLSLNQEC